MNYQSLSALIVLTIGVILALGWLPKRTVNSMKRVIEHREDKYSPSLHLVDENSGTRFSDEQTPLAEGALMQPKQARGAGISDRRIAEIRRLRREATRRRRYIVIGLCIGTIVVLGLSFVLKYSAFYTFIPLVCVLVVLALGVVASHKARDWEHNVAVSRKRAMKNARGSERAAKSVSAHETDLLTSSQQSLQHVDSHAAETDVLEQREIRRALRKAQEEQRTAIARRDSHAQQRDNEVAERREIVQDDSAVQVNSAVRVDSAVQSLTVTTPEDEYGSDISDSTTELSAVRPAQGLDAEAKVLDFVESTVQQDLISFSLGSPRHEDAPKTQEPESLEIKSTRQVARAIAPQPDTEQNSLISAQEGSGSEGTARNHGQQHSDITSDKLQDVSVFHNQEMNTDIDAPQASSDSLSVGLESILARRNG